MLGVEGKAGEGVLLCSQSQVLLAREGWWWSEVDGGGEKMCEGWGQGNGCLGSDPLHETKRAPPHRKEYPDVESLLLSLIFFLPNKTGNMREKRGGGERGFPSSYKGSPPCPKCCCRSRNGGGGYFSPSSRPTPTP